MLNKIVANPVGLSIITGIITFIITWPINNWLTKKTSKAEYFDRVGKANLKILETCTDYIIMEKTVKDKIFATIIKGICIQNKINEEDAYTVQSVKAILVKDFVNMRLISDDVKKEIIYGLCERPQVEEKEDIIVEKIIHQEAIRSKNEMFTSLITIMVTMLTVTLTFFTGFDGLKPIKWVENISIEWVFIITIVIICIETIVFLYLNLRRKRRNHGMFYEQFENSYVKKLSADASNQANQYQSISDDSQELKKE
ncbi:hypothetical protein [Lacrimispora sp.]|uniref:hypothetical protein n=1 Tax=Lacrimispora sp. TaxID=2719234 RepID=UPI0032E48D6B